MERYSIVLLALFFTAPAWPSDVVAEESDALLPSALSRVTRLKDLWAPGIPSGSELEASGARIGKIRIEASPIFNTADPHEDNQLFRLANRLHVRTTDATIRNQLLIQSGELFQKRLLQESERILRGARYLQDASVVPVAYHDGIVDVAVITQDVWTLNPGISFGRQGGANTSGFELEELNLFGLGNQLSLGYRSGVDRTSTTLLYRDEHVSGTWWSLSTAYSDNSDGTTAQFSLDHPFYALDTRRAVGIDVRSDDRIDSLYERGQISDQFQTRERLGSVYYGWSRGLRDGWAGRVTAGLTYHENRFTSILGETGATQTLPTDRKLVYPWLGYELIQDDFEIARNRNQIEKTEDYLLGTHLQARIGFASPGFGADRDAFLVDAQLSRGFQPTDRQTLLLKSTLAGRLESGDAANLIAGMNARYYFHQSPRRVFVLGLSADVPSNLDPDQQLLLGGGNGLRGYPLRYQSGQSRWLFTAEQRLFSNWYPFRLFNVGGAVFFDAGRASGDNLGDDSAQGVLKDVGLGLRLGNSRSALGNVLHLDVAFPLDGDDSIDSVQFLIETHRSF
jgi:hypothetical protein